MSIMIYFSFIVLFILFPVLLCLNRITSQAICFGGAGIFLSVYVNWNVINPWQERCEESWTNFNVTAFESYFQENLYGQHLVTWAVPKALKAHVSKSDPRKALVLSFHGWTGSGKNYASKMIAETLYGKKQSVFVHWYIATRDFPHSVEAKSYRNKLRREIQEYTKKCEQSLFIFDEMDKMEPGIIDAIKPFIDFYDNIDGINYRKNIFIFLSNAGGSEITRIAFNFWIDGRERDDIHMRHIEPLINQGAFNEIGGLRFSEIVQKNLIDIYIPFLPLEQDHVKKCIAHELKARGLKADKDIVERILNQVIFYPPQFELFSISGCKKISHKVDIYGYED